MTSKCLPLMTKHFFFCNITDYRLRFHLSQNRHRHQLSSNQIHKSQNSKPHTHFTKVIPRSSDHNQIKIVEEPFGLFTSLIHAPCNIETVSCSSLDICLAHYLSLYSWNVCFHFCTISNLFIFFLFHFIFVLSPPITTTATYTNHGKEWRGTTRVSITASA